MKRSGLPRYVTAYWRDGKKYVRARRHGATYYFKSLPGTEAFAFEYQQWLAGKQFVEGVGASRTKTGSVSALIAKYYRSAEWANLSDANKATYKGIIERFRANHGDKPVRLLERRHVRDLMATKAKTPAAANNLMRIIRVMMRFAIEQARGAGARLVQLSSNNARSDAHRFYERLGFVRSHAGFKMKLG